MEQAIYARVENGVIVEYPVYLIHITNRAHPLDWYTPVRYEAKPEVPAFFSLQEEPVISGKEVVVKYKLVPDTLDSILYNLYYPRPAPGEMPSNEPAVVTFANIPPATVERIIVTTRELVQKRLDAFAGLKNYDGILSACSYYGSSTPSFKAEADVAVAARDDSWMALYQYLGKVQMGISPVPKTVAEIEQELPVLTWPT
jgi:hypothetical protein